jgi:hypothetical protein
MKSKRHSQMQPCPSADGGLTGLDAGLSAADRKVFTSFSEFGEDGGGAMPAFPESGVSH